MRLSYHPRARRELKKIVREYNAVRPELGAQFVEAYDAAAEVVLKHGRRMALIRGDIRVMPLKRFPFGIYYRVMPDRIRIVIVKHLRSDPDFGMDRT